MGDLLWALPSLFTHLVLKWLSSVPYANLRVLSLCSSICRKGRLSADNRMSQEAPHNSVVVEVSGSGSKHSNYSSCFCHLHVAFHKFQNFSVLPFPRGHTRTYLTELLWMLEEVVEVVFRVQPDREVVYECASCHQHSFCLFFAGSIYSIVLLSLANIA